MKCNRKLAAPGASCPARKRYGSIIVVGPTGSVERVLCAPADVASIENWPATSRVLCDHA